MKKVMLLVSLILFVSFLTGCGETVNGMVKDGQRIGSGIHKVFIREG